MTVLPDVLRADLSLVFCGTAPSVRSAQARAYYAHRGNVFWQIVYAAGFVPIRLEPADYPQLLRYGIGLTDLNKVQCGVDRVLDRAACDVAGLAVKIEAYRPHFLAFTSQYAAQLFYGQRRVAYGRQAALFAGTEIWVLPSTSGNARPHWGRLVHHWYGFGEVFAGYREGLGGGKSVVSSG